MTPREDQDRALGLRAAHILELAAINGLPIDEVGDPDVRAVRLARRARDAVLLVGCSSAVKLEAAAMLRDGWRPRQKMTLLPTRVSEGPPGKSCALCARDVAGRPVRVEPIGQADGDVLVCAGWGCDQGHRPREGNHSFGRG